jgi:hypothetical protein
MVFIGFETAPVDTPPSRGQQLLTELRELKTRKPPMFVENAPRKGQGWRWRPRWPWAVLRWAKGLRPS